MCTALTARAGVGAVYVTRCQILKRLSTIILLISVVAWPSWAGPHSQDRRITKRSRRAWLKLLKLPYDPCNLAYREESLPPEEQDLEGFKFHRLGKNEYLIEVDCCAGTFHDFRAFAYYNETNRKAPVCRLLRLKTYSLSIDDQIDVSRDDLPHCDASYDPEKKELELFQKHSESGHCGTLAVYGFDHGRPFVKEMRVRKCADNDGNPSDPHTWKKIISRQERSNGTRSQ